MRTVIVEDASRFARELVTQELGILALIKRSVRVLTANGDDLTDSSDPSRKMMRQIAGSFAEYEKARLVAKLKEPGSESGSLRASVRAARAMLRLTRRWCVSPRGCAGASAGIHCGPSRPIWQPAATSTSTAEHSQRPQCHSVRSYWADRSAIVFGGLTAGVHRPERFRLAWQAVMVAGIVLLGFALFGNQTLAALRVSLDALRVAGGILLLLQAIQMISAHPASLSSLTDLERREAMGPGDIAIFPLAFPVIAGPPA